MPFGLLAHADVADRGRDQDPAGVLQRAQHDLDGEGAAVLASRDQLDPRADLLRQGPGGGSGAVRDQALREALRDDALDRLADQLVALVSELFFGLEIEQDDVPALVHHHHRIRSRFQQATVSGLHLR